MKIEWLNDDKTRARLTRGWWWWKRVTEVRRSEKPSDHTYYPRNWIYVTSNTWCEHEIDEKLDQRRTWTRVTKLPRARVVVSNCQAGGDITAVANGEEPK